MERRHVLAGSALLLAAGAAAGIGLAGGPAAARGWLAGEGEELRPSARILPTPVEPGGPPTAGDMASGAPGAWRVLPDVLSAHAVGSVGATWVVLDVLTDRVHFLDAELRLVRSVGGPGDGPGELRTPVGLAVVGDSLVAVLERAGSRLSLFGADGGFRGHLPVRVPGCRAGVGGDLVEDPGRGLAVHGMCGGGGLRWVAARVGLDGSGEALSRVDLVRGGTLTPPFGRTLIAWRERLWVGTPEGCFQAAGEPTLQPVCLPEARPIPLDDSLRAAFDADAALPGAPDIVLPASWPPVVAAVGSPAGPVLSLPTPDGTGREALLREDGVILLLPRDGTPFPGPSGVLLVRPFPEGTGFRFVSWGGLGTRPGVGSVGEGAQEAGGAP